MKMDRFLPINYKRIVASTKGVLHTDPEGHVIPRVIPDEQALEGGCNKRSFFEWFPLLFVPRACLGKIIIFMHKWLKKTVLLPACFMPTHGLTPVPAETPLCQLSNVCPEPVLANIRWL
jgi:hypothetical protein